MNNMVDDLLTSASLRFQRKRRGKAAAPAVKDEVSAPSASLPPEERAAVVTTSVVPDLQLRTDEDALRDGLESEADDAEAATQSGDDSVSEASASQV